MGGLLRQFLLFHSPGHEPTLSCDRCLNMIKYSRYTARKLLDQSCEGTCFIMMKDKRRFFILLILFLLLSPVESVKAKTVKYCGFTVNRTKANQKAQKVKTGSTKLTLKKGGFIKFTASSRGEYTFTWKSAKHVKIIPFFTLNKNVLCCHSDEEFEVHDGRAQARYYIGDIESTKYGQILSGGYSSNKGSIVLDQGEEIFFYLKGSAKVKLKITRKSLKEKKLSRAIIQKNYERLIQEIEKTRPGETEIRNLQILIQTRKANGYDCTKLEERLKLAQEPALKAKIHSEYSRDFEAGIVLKGEKLFFVFSMEGQKEKWTASFTYDKSTISGKKINIHVIKYESNSLQYDADATADINKLIYTTDIRFKVNRKNKKKTDNYIEEDALFVVEEQFLETGKWILKDLGMSFKDLGFSNARFI